MREAMMPPTSRTALLLLLLLAATQLLLVGGGQLGLVPDAALLQAFQRTAPAGKDPVLDATEQIIKNSPILLVTNDLLLHQAVGYLGGILAGVVAALYFSWRRKATWGLLPLLLLGTYGAAVAGIPARLSSAALGPLHRCFGALAWQWALLATGGVLVAGALPLLLAAGRVARNGPAR